MKVDEKKQEELDASYADGTSCFGKLLDPEDAECQKCKDAKYCAEYVKKATKAVPAKTEKPAKAEKVVPTKTEKVAPAKTEKVAPAKTEKPAKAEKAAPVGREKDENGFSKGSKGSLIYSLLKAGKSTKEQILEVLDKEFSGQNNKTTLGVFFSDVQKDVGKYSASRGITIVTGKTGVLSIKK